MRLVPKFNEHEKTAKSLSWPEKYWPLLLQSTFVGKAQKVYATLSEEQCSKYATVKATILNAYELVLEAYIGRNFEKLLDQMARPLSNSLDKRKLFLIVGILVSQDREEI